MAEITFSDYLETLTSADTPLDVADKLVILQDGVTKLVAPASLVVNQATTAEQAAFADTATSATTAVNATNATNAVNADTVDGYHASALIGMSSPAGAVTAYAGSVAPTNWLECNGDAVSRTTYAALFAVIGTTFGVGNGSSTFNLPDLRGEFVRGWDHAKGVDSGRALGSSQADALKSHTHTAEQRSSTGGAGNDFPAVGAGAIGPGSISLLNTGGAETRPRNVALMYIIKY